VNISYILRKFLNQFYMRTDKKTANVINMRKIFAWLGVLLVIATITTASLPVNATVSSDQTYKDEITVVLKNL